jgi:hypothetical protein
MKPQSCFATPKHLEEAAELAEQRKRDAIARLAEKLRISNRDCLGQARRDLIDSDKPVLEEKGR